MKRDAHEKLTRASAALARAAQAAYHASGSVTRPIDQAHAKAALAEVDLAEVDLAREMIAKTGIDKHSQ